MLIRKFKTEQTGENFVIIFWGGMKNNEKILLNVEFLTREFKIFDRRTGGQEIFSIDRIIKNKGKLRKTASLSYLE